MNMPTSGSAGVFLKGGHPATYVGLVTKSIRFSLKGGFLLLQNLK